VSKNLTSGAALVVDPASGSVLYEAGSAAPLTPASNAKLATAVAALTVLGPTRRIATNVVVRDRDVYLVGGGDPTLASVSTDPSIPTLAQLAEKTLTQVGSGTALSLHYDDSAFAGPTLAAGWSSSYPRIGEVAPVTAQNRFFHSGIASRPTASKMSFPAECAENSFVLRTAPPSVPYFFDRLP
jgi:D-alanyl-D-alanine carboxypeptidase/D-alanyl-D-alanine-endopeptidase (penicillin-binding protein 4)